MNNFYKINSYLFLSMLITIYSSFIFAQSKLTDYVNPFIGTDAHGHTYPGASLPFGMVQLSPDTGTEGWDWCSGYHYSDNSIIGFSHTHLSGTGCADYGDILFMPTVGKLKFEPGTKENPDLGYRSRFRHENETAKPGFYSVFLDDYNILAELTVTKRAGFHKYTFPQTEEANIIIDLLHGIEDKVIDSELRIVNENIVEGYRTSTGWAKKHSVFFYAEFSKPFETFGIVKNGKESDQRRYAKGENVKAFVRFSTNANETVLVKVGISHTSLEGARKNLKSEIIDWDFNKVRIQAENEWEKSLSSIVIESNSDKNKTIFYTALYHSLLNPNTFSDVDGSYMGMDKNVNKIIDREMYTVFSLWDTFRSVHPLFTIIDKKRANDMVAALISKYDEYGLLPVWELAANETGTMIGNHSIPVIVDAFFKGIRDYDIEKAYKAMKKSALQEKHGLDLYREMGFIPSDLEHESVSKTLEYAYNDWCIAQMAKELGRQDDYAYFIERSKFYTNVFDPTTSLMRPKKNGKWFEPFDPYSVSGDYTEANAWQYSFFVPHDIKGLVNLMGSEDKFISKLDELFTTNPLITGRFQSDITGMIGQYAHGNEPSHHMAYLYNYVGVPWNTQEKVNEIITTLYSDEPDGLPGNEDCGQMSAWYVFSTLGFYPVCPGDVNYIIGAPFFKKATLNIDQKNKFVITANNLSEKNKYIQSVRLNNEEHNYSYIKHADIIKGGKLEFEMGPQPSEWGSSLSARPISSVDEPFIAVPFLTSGERVFRDSINVTISIPDNEVEIYYTLDSSDPIKSGTLYISPINIKNSTELKAVGIKRNKYSKIVTANFNKIPNNRNVTLNTQYHPSYTGGGELGLIDGIKGSMNFRTDAWQGYEGVDLDVIIDLGDIQKVSLISTSFLQETRSWIFYPSLIEYYVSIDGNKYLKVYEIENIIDENPSAGINHFEKIIKNTNARYIKVYAKNISVCPDWHVAAGGKSWIFIDEVTIK